MRMISSYSDAVPHASHSPSPIMLFEQTIFQGQVGNNFLQRGRLRAQLLDHRRRRLTGRIIPCQALLARFEEFLRLRVVQALADALTPLVGVGDALLPQP